MVSLSISVAKYAATGLIHPSTLLATTTESQPTTRARRTTWTSFWHLQIGPVTTARPTYDRLLAHADDVGPLLAVKDLPQMRWTSQIGPFCCPFQLQIWR